METVNIALAMCLGLGLSAACGFRVFIPPFADEFGRHEWRPPAFC